MPFFSVVVPLYNKENYIEATLRSVLAQTFSDFEIIVVNDGSTDQGPEKVKKIEDPRIVLIHQENKGASAARNFGIGKATGNYIALQDADDFWYPNHLQNLRGLISLFPKAGLYSTAHEVELEGKIVKKPHYPFEIKAPCLIKDYFSASLVNAIAMTPTVAFAKKTFYEIGVFDESLRSGQDMDFFIRAALKVPIAFTPEVSMQYLKKTENNLRLTDYNRDRIELINKYKVEEKDNVSLKKYLDVNRYAIALRCKLKNDDSWKKLAKELNPNNLNAKQRFLLKMPAPMLRAAIEFQRFLMKFGIYWTAFK